MTVKNKFLQITKFQFFSKNTKHLLIKITFLNIQNIFYDNLRFKKRKTHEIKNLFKCIIC